MKKLILFFAIAFSINVGAQIKVKDLPTTTFGASGDFIIKDDAAGTPGSTKKISVGNFLNTYSVITNTVSIRGAGTTTVTSSSPYSYTITSSGGGSIGGSGATNFIPIFTNSVTLGNSYLFKQGNNISLSTGKYLTGADTTKLWMNFGTPSDNFFELDVKNNDYTQPWMYFGGTGNSFTGGKYFTVQSGGTPAIAMTDALLSFGTTNNTQTIYTKSVITTTALDTIVFSAPYYRIAGSGSSGDIFTRNSGGYGSWQPPTGGGGTLTGSGVGQRVAIWQSPTAISSYAPFTYDTTSEVLQIGEGTPLFTQTKRLNIMANGLSGIPVVITNTVSTDFMGLQFSEDVTHFGNMIRLNSAITSSVSGTAISNQNMLTFRNGSFRDQPVSIHAYPFYFVSGGRTANAPTNMGFRADTIGLRIAQNQNLHTQNTDALEVQGSFKYVYGTPGVGKSLVDDGSGVGRITWGAASAGTQTLSVLSNSLTISGGNTVIIPTASLTAGSGVLLTGSNGTYTVNVAPPQIYVPVIASNTVTINGHNAYQEVDSISSSVTTLTVSYSNIAVGETVILNYMKTTASNCVITFPTGTLLSSSCVSATSGLNMTLVSGATGDFLIWITRMNGGRYIVTEAQNTP